MDYTQPDFYKFSEDSVLLSRLVFEHLEAENKGPYHLLDVGCGCGVIGLEVMRKFHRANPHSLILLEKEVEFLPCIEKNRTQFLLPETDVTIFNQDFLDFKTDRPITHILSNPPYFLTERGRASPNALKQNCRSWSQESALMFLEHLSMSCRSHRARGLICGRKEIQGLLDQVQIPYEVLLTKKETSFYLLF